MDKQHIADGSSRDREEHLPFLYMPYAIPKNQKPVKMGRVDGKEAFSALSLIM